MSRKVLLLFVLIHAISLSGCATLEQVGQVLEGQKPTAQVNGVRLTSLDFEGMDLAFDVQVDNPNPVGISLAGLDYDLSLLGSRFLKGDQPMGMRLAANGNSSVEVPMRLGFQQLLSTYQQLKGADSAGYQLDLGMGFDVPVLGRVRVPVSYQGEFPVPKMPDVKVRSLDVQQLSMSGAKLMMQLEVDNPNAFSLLLNQLNYDVKLNGYNVGSGLMGRAVNLQQGSPGVINLPLSLDFAQAGMGLYKALLGSGIRYDLNGSMEASSSNPILKHFQMPLKKQGRVSLR
ncbi:MAG: LEA type 2 family protein [Candidatus Thiodiazotropha sp. (ex Myrtea sp. 'scaly one' KF741663)]|nr:LEA type 2 family protein [Candidatus Thiodiazotropha sp. (ex Myrtea sp. 'scaly one' KF741663)]